MTEVLLQLAGFALGLVFAVGFLAAWRRFIG